MAQETPNEDEFATLAIKFLAHPIARRASKPGDDSRQELAPVHPHAKVIPLRSNEDWDTFHSEYVQNKHGNLKPWYRCVSILRKMGAKTAVQEDYYVCLDYRSEFAAFYAHIDAPRRSSTLRLHFFNQEVSEKQVMDLSKSQRDGYLGYIVCREGDLPLVGRTVIRTPNYIEQSTAVAEPVNFFAQRLVVHDVPFMQQDQRFAVCAHVAAWVLHYTAFRRGVQERRHIADLVDAVGPIHPLRPKSSDGLTGSQVSDILNELGFRAKMYFTPTVEDTYHSLPEILPVELSVSLRNTLESAGVSDFDQGSPDLLERLEERLGRYLYEPENTTHAEEGPGRPVITVNPDDPRVHVFHALIDYLIHPYIKSGWPVYAGTPTHAFVICGRSNLRGKPVFFLHDDQKGPYLVAESLPALSRESLRYQSGFPQMSDRMTAPKRDVVQEILLGASNNGNDARQAMDTLIVAAPSRVLLSPASANRHACNTILAARSGTLLLDLLSEADRAELTSTPTTTASILMGIDYKSLRRLQALKGDDSVGVCVFSSMQLAEWVIVVEGLDETGQCIWEFVYDASSSDIEPRVQFARLFSAAVAHSVREDIPAEASVLGTARYSSLKIPLIVGKTDTYRDTDGDGTDA